MSRSADYDDLGFDPDDPTHKRKLAELATSDRETAHLYRKFYRRLYEEEPK